MIAAAYVYTSEPTPGFDLAQAPLAGLTHLILSFADVSPDLVPVWAPPAGLEAVRARFPGLRILVAVGGWTWSGRFSDAAATPDRRHRFAAAAARLVDDHGLDGLDIDWEFPVVGGLPENVRREADRENFTLLLEALRGALDEAGARRGRRLDLTAAVGAGQAQVEALETSLFHRHLDFLNLMTYDFHGSWNPEPGHNSSLADTEASVRLHLDRGFPAEKVVVGTPLYAHQWVKDGGAGAPWKAGPVLLWHEAEAQAHEGNWVWDEAAGASRLEEKDAEGRLTRVVTYDDARALEAKAALVGRLGLGGLMTWQVTGDPRGTQLGRLGSAAGAPRSSTQVRSANH